MSDKKYQIFVSSTYTDLIDTRKKVIDAILRLEHFPVGMEWFSASGEEQWEIIENELKTTDYYILILGQRYGTLNSEGIGYTEKEYNYAREMGIPVLSFVRNENAPYTNDEREEKRDGQKRIKLFREKVLKESMVDFWETPEELVSKVLVALNKQIKRTKRTGWVRGDQAMSADMANELVRLSKENSELREKLSNLQVNERKPNFELLINNQRVLNLKVKDRDKIVSYFEPIDKASLIKIEPHDSDRLRTYEFDDIKTKFIEEIDKYNESIVDFKMKKLIETMASSITHCEENVIFLKLLLKNNGNLIGKNIACTISFPKEVLFFDLNKWNSYLREIEGMANKIVPQKPILEPSGFGQEIIFKKSIEFNTTLNHKNNRGTGIRATMDYVHINVESLLHTRSVNMSDYITIHPLKRGTFELLVNIISEELTEPIEYSIPIVVE